MFTFRCISSILIHSHPLLAGFLFDVTGDYEVAFYVAGAAIATAGLICLPLRMVSRCVDKRSGLRRYPRERTITLVDEELDEFTAKLNGGDIPKKTPIPTSLLKMTTSTMSLELIGNQINRNSPAFSQLSLDGNVSALTGSNPYIRLNHCKRKGVEYVQNVGVV